MPSEMLHYFFKSSNKKTRLQFQIALQCGPFLKKLKVACIITLETEMYTNLEEMLENTGIQLKILSVSKNRYLLLFFYPDRLQQHLRDPHVQEFLKEYGYTNSSLSWMLKRLEMRINQFAKRNMGFPHEIGVFLEYPIEDVKGFIKFEGKGYLMTGYWKVYSNPQRARKIFQTYDHAKMCAVNEFLTGKSIREIAFS